MKNAIEIIFAVIFAVVVLVCGIRVYTLVSERKQAREEYTETVSSYVTMSDKAKGQTGAGVGGGSDAGAAGAGPVSSAGSDSVAGSGALDAAAAQGSGSEAGAAEGAGGSVVAEETVLALCPLEEVNTKGLLSVNRDFDFWLSFEEGGVNYPVVLEQEDARDRYLATTFEGTHGAAGCLFVSAGQGKGLADLNTIVYGHNMKDGTMMGGLSGLYNAAGYGDADGPVRVWAWTGDDRILMYTVFAMYVTKETSDMFVSPEAEEYEDYVEKAVGFSNAAGHKFQSSEAAAAIGMGKPILTLSTCYGPAGGPDRLLIHAVLTGETKAADR